MNGVINGFVVIGVVVAVGYFVGRAGVLGPTATHVLSRAAFFVASPALLFTTLSRTDVGAVFSTGLVITAVTSSVACLLYVPIGLLRRRPGGETTVGAMASGYVNAGNLGLPLAAYALGDAAEVAPVLLFQLAVLTPLFTTVLDVLTEHRDGHRPSLLRSVTAPVRNPIAVATGAGITVSATGVTLSESVIAPIELISNLSVPGMLLAFGISLCGAKRPGSEANALLLVSVLLIKNIVHPLLALLLGLVLGLAGHALLAVVLCAALPTAQNVFGYAVRFGQGVALGRDAALCTTLLSVPVLVAVVALLA